MSPEDSAAQLIQRAFRTESVLFRKYGHGLFIMADGGPAAYGKVDFASITHDPTIEPARFIVLSDSSSPADLAKLLRKTWNIPMPDVIISVTGSAQAFELPPELQRNLDEGMVSVLSNSHGWLLSGGTDTGIMRALGDLKARQRTRLRHVPLVGIASWGNVKASEVLKPCLGETVHYPRAAATEEGAPLNPNTSHFVLVDSNKTGRAAWGSEIALRTGLENHFHEVHRPCPDEACDHSV